YNEVFIRQLIEDDKSKECAVITLDEFKKEAADLFGKERVYTVDEIKGLQYVQIIIYKFFDSKDKEIQEVLAYANECLAKRNSQLLISTNRPKERDAKSEAFWKNLNVAIGRPLVTAVFAQEKH